MKKILKENKFIILFFIATTFLAFLFPLSGDDYMWGTSDGINLLQNGFKDYNGRYLGNISAIVLTRLDFIRPVVKGFTLTVILYLIQKITGNKSKDYICLSSVLLIFPSMLLIQGVIWTAGFTNYCLSSMIIMVSLYLVFYKKKKNIFHVILIVILGVSGQLFMETYTLFCLVMALSAVIYFAVKDKKADVSAIVYFVSCVSGAVIMFRNGVYGKVVSGDNNYQSLSGKTESLLGTLMNQFENLFSKVFSNMFIACFPAIIVLTAICFVALKKYNGKNKKIILGAEILSILMAVVFVIITILQLPKHEKFEDVKVYVGVAVLFLLLPSVITILFCFDKKTRIQAFKYIGMILVTSLPFCVIGPVGSRCFMPANILIIMIIGKLCSFESSKRVSAVIKTVALLVFAVNAICYSVITLSCHQKAQTAKEQVEHGEKIVELEKTKFGFMLHAPDEEWHHLVARRFSEYNGLPEDTQYVFK